MTVLVTGGAGYIGSHTVHDLVDAGESVIVLDNLSTGFVSALPRPMLPVVGDVGDRTLVASLIEQHSVEAIIHFAGSTIVPESMKDPLGYYGNNTANSRALIEAAVDGGVKHFIFSSTAAVYGNPVRVPVFEDDPTVPLSPYGWSKLMTEQMLRDTSAAHPLTHVALRYFNVAGADPKLRTGLQTPGATHLIKVAVEAALGRRERIDVFGSDYDTPDGTCIRDFIHVSDLARAHRAALNYLRSGSKSVTLNCGYGRGYSVREVINQVKAVSGVDFAVRESPRRAGDPASVVARATKVRELLGWQPEHEDLRDIVTAAYDWERYLATRNR
jgi:UDP-glucose 4-epimerase